MTMLRNQTTIGTPPYMFFFFSSRRRHTRYWRDWSSDVCSSDLQREDGRVVGHLCDHVLLQHARGRQPEEHVGAHDHLRQRALRSLLRKHGLVFVHQLGAALVDQDRKSVV